MLGLITATVLGCSGASAKWYGTWEGDLQRAQPDTPVDLRNSINLLRIRILPDGTFQMVESGVPLEGTHQLGSERAYLKIKKRFGRPIEGAGTVSQNQDLTLTWQPDGSLLWSDPSGQLGHPVRLTLKSQPAD